MTFKSRSELLKITDYNIRNCQIVLLGNLVDTVSYFLGVICRAHGSNFVTFAAHTIYYILDI
jgi:hypothetical protein